MNHFLSIKELLNTLSRENKLLTEMFEQRKSLSYKYEDALELVENDEDRIERLIEKTVLRQNGAFLEVDDQFLQFFEHILEINEEINTSYINENIEQVKQFILYYNHESSESRRYTFLKSIKSGIKKIGTLTLRNIVDLNRNIENTFKTEPNYKIKLAKLENHKRKLANIRSLIEQTEKLVTEDEQTFFKTASDEELKIIITQLRLQLAESRDSLVEAQKQIVEFINQMKYQSKFVEKLRQIKYLKDQFELRAKTDVVELLANMNMVAFESKPSYPLKISLDHLQKDEAFESIIKANTKLKSNVKHKVKIAEAITNDYLNNETEEEWYINLEEIKNKFLVSDSNLFDFIMNHSFPKEVLFQEQVTVYCQLLSMYEDNFNITENYERKNGIEYAMVYPR